MQQKSKATEYISENELKSLIKSGISDKCFLLFGDEQYMMKRYIKNISAVAAGEFEEFNINRFDGAVNAQSFYDAVCSFPLMNSSKVVTLCDYPFDKASAAETAKILSAVVDRPPTTVLIIWFETVVINKKKPGEKISGLFKAVNDAGGKICFIGRKSVNDIIRLLQAGSGKRLCHLEASVARYMTEVCSDDLSTLINELDKLCTFVGEGGTITTETVDRVCSRSVEASVYDISKAVLRNDLSGALKLLDDLCYMNIEPDYLIMLISSAYIDLYRCFAARTAGKRAENIAKDFGYFATAFRLTDAERKLGNFTEQMLTGSLKVLSDCDKNIKSSRCDPRTQLEKALAELTIIARKN